jgi:hypothetical protein
MPNEDVENTNEKIILELLKAIPEARRGFPPPDELDRIKRERHAAYIRRWERLERDKEGAFQELKRRALANLRKDNP